MKRLFAFALIALISFTLPALADEAVPAGHYQLDKTHASLLFRVNHMGISHYTARFTRFDAKLDFDPQRPETAGVEAKVDVTSLQTNYPEKTIDFDAELQNDKWLDAKHFPEMTFRSTKVEVTGANTAKVTGDLELHGMKAPVTLDVTYNGGFAKMPMGQPGSRIGFSARGTLKRSAFGVSEGIPQPGSNMGVGDDVEIIIEAEFVKPSENQ